jgi:hypothetical protein
MGATCPKITEGRMTGKVDLPFRIVAKRRKDASRAAELQAFFAGIWTDKLTQEYEVVVSDALVWGVLYGDPPSA